jgi:hypothetical protein
MRSERKAFGLDLDGALASGPAGWLRESGSRLGQSKVGNPYHRNFTPIFWVIKFRYSG